MNNKKQLKSTYSRLLQRLASVLILIISIISFGCLCDCDEDADEYYVKYEINCTHLVGGHANAEIIVSAENKDLTFNIEELTSWETTIGPVQKGFNATLEVNVSNAVVLLYTYLYVSKNDSPFALKASGGSESIDDPKSNAQISYKIDY